MSSLESFRNKIHQALLRRTIGKKPSKMKNNGMSNSLPLHEMVSQIEELIQSEDFLLNARETFVATERKIVVSQKKNK